VDEYANISSFNFRSKETQSSDRITEKGQCMNMQTVLSGENYHDNGVDVCPELSVLQKIVSGTLQGHQF
jgi:hypothetical protein